MNEVFSYLSGSIRTSIIGLNIIDSIQEIRLRVLRPVIIVANNEEYIPTPNTFITYKELEETLELMSNYSLYSFEEQIKQGFLTIKGGHRIGIVGKSIIENGSLKTIRNISGLNIRIAHQVEGCSNKILPYIVNERTIFNTLIVSPPKCGKTTIIRDLAKNISNGWENFKGLNVSIVDERSEIAACYNGVNQNDVGFRTDVLDNCPKTEGMRILLRAMSPNVIIVDEIGSIEDAAAIKDILSAGVKVICSIHAASYEDIMSKQHIAELVNEKQFEKLVFLSNKNGVGTIEGIMDVSAKRWEVGGCYA